MRKGIREHRFIKGTGAIVVAMSLVIGIASCEKNAVKNKKLEITEDTPWYNPSVTVLSDGQYDESEYEYLDSSFVGTWDNLYVIHESGALRVPENFDYESDDYSDFQVSRLLYVDSNGETVNEFDLGELTSELESEGLPQSNWVDITIEGDEISFCYGAFDPETGAELSYYAICNANTMELLSFEKNNPLEESLQLEGSFILHDYTIDTYWMSEDEGYSYTLRVRDQSGNEERLNLEEILSEKTIYDITSIIDMGNNAALLVCYDINDPFYLKLDLTTMTVTEVQRDYSFLTDDVIYASSYYDDQLGVIYLNDSSICTLDFENQEIEDVFSFDNTNVNRNQITSYEILDYSEDEITLIGTIYINEPGGEYITEIRLLTLTKAETNPNVGKTILKLANVGDSYLSDATCEAIVDYNNASENAFIVYDDRYTFGYEDIRDQLDDDASNYTTVNWTMTSELSNQLLIDMMAGEGPDIIMDGYDLTAMNREDYLLDLTDMIPANANQHVIELSKTGDKLYQMPTSYSLYGMIIDSSAVEDGQIGFTYDEYVTFVDEVMNGRNLYEYYTRNEVLAQSVGYLHDLLVDDNGKINFNNEEFKELAAFVKDNIIDPDFESGDYFEQSYYGIPVAYLSALTDSHGIINELNNRSFLGIPSSERRGPGIVVETSVAISAATASPEEAKAFLNSCVSDESQRYIYWSIPISDSVLRDDISQNIEEYNEEIDRMSAWYTPEEAIAYGVNLNPIDEGFVDEIFGIINRASTVIRTDPQINRILAEEIPAYYDGSKTIDEVITIIQDKVDTIISERG